MSEIDFQITASAGQRRPDVCLLLEGTWPYVRGGVSTWVHQILTSLPEVAFSVVFVGAEKKVAGSPKYEAPPNLVGFTETFLFDRADSATPSKSMPRAARQLGKTAHDALRRLLLPENGDDEDTRVADAFLALASVAERVSFEHFWAQPDTWKLLHDCYSRYFERTAFNEYFWNVRFLLEPVWRLLRVENQLPQAPLYHSVSTGYAGLLGALAVRQRTDSRFLLSEHGIYVRERIADLLRSEWARPGSLPLAGSGGIPPLRRLWIDFFVEIGKFSYHSAARIVSLFQRNAVIQTEFGAPSDRQMVIPNGVDVARFKTIREARTEKRAASPHRQIVGFFGRVVAIKDVKTLLRAARATLDRLPGARFLIVGPIDEDAAYYEDCARLTGELGIDDFVKFTGPAPADQALPEFDLMVLSSASEGLPFAVLEAFASGMPVVCTDVGSCSELIHGRDGESPALGPAGAVVPAGNPGALAKAIADILSDRSLQDRLGAVGLARTERYYDEQTVIGQYRDLYHSLIGEAAPVS